MHMTWPGVAAAYFAAKAEEDAYDHEFCCFDRTLPVGPERSAAIDAIPREHMDEAERLQNIRCDIEDRLLALPSPSPSAFALKVMICRGDGRDLNGYDDVLETEARQILAASAFGLPPSGLRPDWDRALGEFEHHLARFDALTGTDYTNEQANEIAADYNPAREAMIGTPVPDLPALLRKFEIMWGADDRLSGNPDQMDIGMFLADLRRLAGAA